MANKSVVLMWAAVPDTCCGIKAPNQASRVSSNDTVTVWERFSDYRICANDCKVTQLDARENYRAHSNPAIISDPYSIQDVPTIIVRVVVRTNNAYICGNLRVVSDQDFTNSLNVAARH